MISAITGGAGRLGPAISRAGSGSAAAFGAVLTDANANAAAKPVARAEPEPADRAPGSAARLDEAIAAFHKEASLTPAQRIRRDVLKSLKLTEETLKELPAKEREAIEQKVAAEVARRLRLGANGKADHAGATPAADPMALRA